MNVSTPAGGIAAGQAGGDAAQLAIVATCPLTAPVNHEYQHGQRIGEVRAGNPWWKWFLC
jgi:hypothetical protein